VSSFLGGAYLGGNALIDAFTSAVKSANLRIDADQGEVAPVPSDEGKGTNATVQSVIPKKFGFSIER
jgi:hypothetical protein